MDFASIMLCKMSSSCYLQNRRFFQVYWSVSFVILSIFQSVCLSVCLNEMENVTYPWQPMDVEIRANLQDPHSLMTGGKPQGNLPGSDCASLCRGGAEVSSTRRRSPWVNLRRSLRVGAWNALSLREDDYLSQLSSELKRLNIAIAALSEVQRPDSGEIMEGGYTYNWSGALTVTLPKQLCLH